MSTNTPIDRLAELLPPADQERMSIPEVSRMTGRSSQTLYNMVASGRLKSWRLFGRVFTTREAVIAHLEAEAEEAHPPPTPRRESPRVSEANLQKRISKANAEARRRGV